MFPLFESICVINGKILNQKWHQIRYQKAYKKYFGKVSQFNLLDQVYIPKEFKKGRVKLKVLYGEKEREIHFEQYTFKIINTIRLVHTINLEYSLKLRQRGKLNELFAKKGNCDDVIIVRNGLITDSSYANLIFFDGSEWITPKVPLLEGTCRARLLASGKIKTGNIGIKELSAFKGFKLINAMRGMNQKLIPIEGIVI